MVLLTASNNKTPRKRSKAGIFDKISSSLINETDLLETNLLVDNDDDETLGSMSLRSIDMSNKSSSSSISKDYSRSSFVSLSSFSLSSTKSRRKIRKSPILSTFFVDLKAEVRESDSDEFDYGKEEKHVLNLMVD